ncbi:MAG: glycerate kinase [Candidatus Adiutrix sp.]|jgi:glycerate kinase|nr:glycerate kinase [Candidatus Adiutrix sp.]
MKIIIAPDSFKGSLSAPAAARAIALGLSRVWPEAECRLYPLADGGEGTVETLIGLTGGQLVVEEVLDPLGRPVEAAWGLLGDGLTAVVEVASACGLTRLEPGELDPARASSYGVGQQIRQALGRGVKKLVVGLGGSATNDAGAGMLSALGLKFFDQEGRLLPPGGLALARLGAIDASELMPELGAVSIVAATDVQNPLTGACGASAVFGPQKGVAQELVESFDLALGRFAAVSAALTGREAADKPGAGAAGGLGAAFMFFTEARFQPGIEFVLAEGRFREKAAGASLIITGEGSSDGQTIWGKAPVGVAALGRELGIPTVCLSGSLGPGYQKMYASDIAAVMSMLPSPMGLGEAMARAEELLEDAAERLGRLLAVRL